MLVLPWYIRFAIDTAIIATPFIYLHSKFLFTQTTQPLTSLSTSKINEESPVEGVFA